MLLYSTVACTEESISTDQGPGCTDCLKVQMAAVAFYRILPRDGADGTCTQDDLPPRLRASDITCMPSPARSADWASTASANEA